MSSLVDLGCATGHMIKHVKRNHPRVEVVGIEYFEYHKENDECSPLIRDNIMIADLRDPLHIDNKSDLVYSTEVAEHIEPTHAGIYVQNILRCAKELVVLSWSAGKVYSQHFNPLELDEFLAYAATFGLYKDNVLTRKLVQAMDKRRGIYPWYRKSITVFRVGKPIDSLLATDLPVESPSPWNLLVRVESIDPYTIKVHTCQELMKAISKKTNKLKCLLRLIGMSGSTIQITVKGLTPIECKISDGKAEKHIELDPGKADFMLFKGANNMKRCSLTVTDMKIKKALFV
tara:strand:- start:127 stop:990 length:864 start_codon:yes stop_codon:yes gene_type:complete